MKALLAALATGAITVSVQAADKPAIGPAPAWVRPVAPAAAPAKADDAPVRVLLSDQQVDLQPGRQTVYSEVVLKIQTPQGLAAGNVSLPWRPDTDTLTVHKLLIRRGGQTIDVLASGQTFTVVRREQNLESATLDGVLTANIQPEGLQVGDVLEFAASVSSSDPTLKGHVEQAAGAWNGFAAGRAHLRVQWPTAVPIRFRQTAVLPALKPVKTGTVTAVELSLDDVVPVVLPKGAPARYRIGRLVEMTDYASWADLGALMAPLYDKAAVIPMQGPLRTELERIRTLSPDPKVRTEAALALVQDRVRYVALAMGAGGYVPADAETTWARRYGDCKAKTTLLLALLHAMDIQADPVAVSTSFGDGLDARLPMVGLFNHVLVRATIAGRTYWLDGTRTGDTGLDRLAVPDVGWGLPLLAKNAALVRMTPAPLDTPTQDVSIRIDASAGISAPAPAKLETVMRGDEAIGTNAALSTLIGEARDRALKDYWKNQYNFIDVTSTGASFDPKTGELRLSMEGKAKLDWANGNYQTDGTAVGYHADFARDPGPDRDAPFAVPYPYYTRTRETILLPKGAGEFKLGTGMEVDQKAGGIEYRRHAAVTSGVFTIEKTERSVVSEFPAKDAPAEQAALRMLADRAATLRMPSGYSYTGKDIAAVRADVPTTSAGYVSRASLLIQRGLRQEALLDYDKAVELDANNVYAWSNRAITRIQADDLAGARSDLVKAEAIDPTFVQNFIGRGMLAEEELRPRDAVDAYTRALEREPDNGFALGHRAEANRAAGYVEAALQDAAAALKQQPGWTDLYLLRANIFRSQGRPDDALREAAALEAASPDDSYAHVAAANIYGALHKDTEAMKAYDRALALKPEAYVYLNRSLGRPRTDVTGRRADLDAALKLEPDLTQAIAEKARLQADAGDFPGAVATYSAVLVKSPDDADLLVGRGIVRARAGNMTDADKDFAKARSKVTEAELLNNMCWAKATAGVALASALADCDAALAKAPGMVNYLDSRALVLLRLGRIDDAIADYGRALAKSPDLASSLFGRAVAWARKGDRAKSGDDAAAATRIDPDIRTTFDRYGVTL